MSYYYILYGCTIAGTVLSHAFSNALYESTNELIKQQSMKCNNHCPYGFVTDVEGEYTCACYDPCSMIMCQPGRECVVSMPDHCSREICRPNTTCAVSVTAMKIQKGHGFIPSWLDIIPPQQHDDPFSIGNSGSDVSVCSKPIQTEALDCKHKQRRWFYNVMTGRCERFYGCHTEGNNFVRKRNCKDKCKGHMIPPSQLMAILPDDSACAKPPSYRDVVSCDTKSLRRRWFYNEKSGLCEKFAGCEGNGNNFARKVFCKAKCRNIITKFRRSRNTGSRSKAQRPR